ncbi:RIOK2 isoform 7, partial [Pan troglodytes]
DGQRVQGGVPAGSDEYEDECPHLIALSSLNREFRPFSCVSVSQGYCHLNNKLGKLNQKLKRKRGVTEAQDFEDEDNVGAMNQYRTRTLSITSSGSAVSCSTIPPELVKQKVKRQLTKQQKSAVRRRLQKGEANIFTKQRRENMQNIKSSLEAASFWGE